MIFKNAHQMANYSLICFFVLLFSCLLSVSHGDAPSQNPSNLPIRAVNLGGWLVAEGSIKPSLFEGIINKDFLDGTGLQFKSPKFQTYLAADNGGGATIVANSTSGFGWETFILWRINEYTFNFRVFNKQFVGLDKSSTTLVATATAPSSLETFEIVRNVNDQNLVRIKASNGQFLQVKSRNLVTADYPEQTTWGIEDPSVFRIDFNGTIQGEYQLANGYGPVEAQKVLLEHWRTFIVEDDFKFIKDNGLNAVRIPVGWWINQQNPPKPFVAGSIGFLDSAFLWAQEYGLKVIIDVHAAPGSQNGKDSSATRDGSQEWGQTDESIQQTVAVIDYLAARYTHSPTLLAIQLLNEPLSPGISLETITKYYKAAYDAVRKYSPTLYVILANRLGPSNNTELLPLTSGFTNSVIDVHFYNLNDNIFTFFTPQKNVEFVQTNRTAEMTQITKLGGPLLFVGEWVAEMQNSAASKEQIQAYAGAQLDVYGKATFGWGYFTLKSAKDHWSLQWMINNGYIKLSTLNLATKY